LQLLAGDATSTDAESVARHRAALKRQYLKLFCSARRPGPRRTCTSARQPRGNHRRAVRRAGHRLQRGPTATTGDPDPEPPRPPDPEAGP
jgi:hypothetical protein